MKKKVLGIIPARFASSRFPGKPLALILGKSLIQRTYENTLKASSLDAVVIATDDERIYEHVLSFGGKVAMTPTFCLTGTDRLAALVQSHPEYQEYDYLINIQGDEPCLETDVIEKVISALKEEDEPIMASAACLLENQEEAISTSIVKTVFDGNRNALYFSRALIPASKTGNFDKKVSYYKHLGIYGYRKEFLLNYIHLQVTPLQQAEDLEQLKVLEHGKQIRLAIVKSQSIGVDNPEDIKKVETYLCKQNTFS